MDRLSPIDIERARFQRKFRGLDEQAVQNLLLRAAKEIELLRRELSEARSTTESLEQELNGFRKQETALKESLLLAHRAADETRSNAHKEAQLILQEAASQVTETQKQAQKRINDMRWELERLSIEKQRFESRFRALLQEHLDAIALPAHQPALVNLEVGEFHDEDGDEEFGAVSGA